MIFSDILIIGGGPAGLSTALHIAKYNPLLLSSPQGMPSIMLLEKAHYPRPKLCAGGLTVDAETLLEQLGLDVGEVPHADSSEVHFDFEGKGLRIINRRRHTLRVIRRDEFDAWLAGKARESGIEIRAGVTVTDVKPDREGVTVVTNNGVFRAKIVIGADGSNGVTRRCVMPKDPIYTARVLEVIVTDVIKRRATTKQSPGEKKTAALPTIARSDAQALFELSPIPQNISGYIWDFPTQVKGQPRRCWGIYDANLLSSQKRPPLKELLRDEMAKHGLLLDEYELQGYPIRCFEPGNRVSVPRVLLAGDAAGADPLFGEGISIALGYGLWAAKESIRALGQNDFSFNGSKVRLARSGLGQTLFARWFIANIIYTIKWRWFQFLLWRVLKPIVILVAWIFILNWSKRMRI